MSRFSIVFDDHCKCIKSLLSDYSWVTEACDLFLGLARIRIGWHRYWLFYNYYLFWLVLYVHLDLGFCENYWCVYLGVRLRRLYFLSPLFR